MEHPIAFLSLTVLTLLVVLLIFGMKYVSAGRIAGLKRDADTNSRNLASKMTDMQTETASTLAQVRAELAEIKSVLNTVAQLLKEVQ